MSALLLCASTSMAMLDTDIQALLALAVDQISFYPLMTSPQVRRR